MSCRPFICQRGFTSRGLELVWLRGQKMLTRVRIHGELSFCLLCQLHVKSVNLDLRHQLKLPRHQAIFSSLCPAFFPATGCFRAEVLVEAQRYRMTLVGVAGTLDEAGNDFAIVWLLLVLIIAPDC